VSHSSVSLEQYSSFSYKQSHFKWNGVRSLPSFWPHEFTKFEHSKQTITLLSITVSDMAVLANIYLVLTTYTGHQERLPFRAQRMPALKIATTVAMNRQLAGAANLLHDNRTDIHHLQVFVGAVDQALVNHLPPSTLLHVV